MKNNSKWQLRIPACTQSSEKSINLQRNDKTEESNFSLLRRATWEGKYIETGRGICRFLWCLLQALHGKRRIYILTLGHENRELFPAFAVSYLSLAQNDFYVKEPYFRVRYSSFLQWIQVLGTKSEYKQFTQVTNAGARNSLLAL